MGKSKKALYTKEEREDKETIRKLKETVRDLLSHNKQLKSEISTLEDAFAKARQFMKDENEDMSLEELIQAANDHLSSKQAKKKRGNHKGTHNEQKQDRHPQTVQETQNDTREKWKKWREKNFGVYKEEDK